MFYLGALYWLSDISTLCSDVGAYSVTGRDECHLTLPFVQEVYPSADENIAHEFSSAGYPVGCFLYISGDTRTVYLNSHETGSRNNYNRDICKGNGKLRKAISFSSIKCV